MTPRFLSVEDVIRLHRMAIEDSGGDSNLRDLALLESAIAQPSQQFDGSFLHPSIPEMAAAYAFHVCSNHPFVDGNKRAALASMLAFLVDNGWSFDADVDEAERAFVSLGSGTLSKAEFVAWLEPLVHEKSRMELREYFQALAPERFTEVFLGLLPAVTGARAAELQATATDAARHIPALRQLISDQATAKRDGNDDAWVKVTVAALTLVTLFRIAEEMGYEW